MRQTSVYPKMGLCLELKRTSAENLYFYFQILESFKKLPSLFLRTQSQICQKLGQTQKKITQKPYTGNRQEAVWGEDVSTKKYTELIQQNLINQFRGKQLKPTNLYNHKCRYNNDLDLKAYKLMKLGKYLNHKENFDAVQIILWNRKRKWGYEIYIKFCGQILTPKNLQKQLQHIY